MRPIGLFGGTFDPVHLGHLRSALEILECLDLAEMRFIPSADPPHRPAPNLPADVRLKLLTLALKEQAGFAVETCELTRIGKSYTVDTLIELRQRYGEQPLCLILGTDAFLGLPSWSRWQQLTDFAHIVVAKRPGWHVPDDWEGMPWLGERMVQQPMLLHEQPSGRIYFQTVTPLDISATMIRSQLAAGRSIRYLVPDSVWQYIEAENKPDAK